MGKVIAITNQKGGVGKTTTAVNLAAGLTANKKSVLCIDTDSQGSLSICLGIDEPDNENNTLAELMAKIATEEEYILEDYIRYQKEGIDFIIGNIQLQALEQQIVSLYSREYLLKEIVDSVKEKYDYIIIDCPPSLGIILANDLTAADSIIIPAKPERLSTKGLEQLFSTIKKVKKTTNRTLNIDGILFTMINARSKYNQNISEMVTDAFGSYVNIFDAKIPSSVRVAETPETGTSLFAYDPNGKCTQAYRKLVEEVMNNG
ncbi:MAG: ParA family protein [Lachnospiraceae bacterium]|jgi:chromosome partitioning protein|nr:ParA family protein [Lachnospiraceae bacterium]